MSATYDPREPFKKYDDAYTGILRNLQQAVTKRKVARGLTQTSAGVSTSPPSGGGGGGVNQITMVSVADIDDPSPELNARTGDAAGSLLLVYQTNASGSIDFSTLYRTDNSNLTEAIPWIVDSGDGKSYSAIAGLYQLPTRVMENFVVGSGGTLSFSSSSLFSSTLCQVNSESGLTIGRGNLLLTGASWSYSTDGGATSNVGVLEADPSTLTADRTWTLPDLTGTVLLDTTPYTSFPTFSGGAQLLLGSDDGGTTSEIDLGTTLEIAGTTLRVKGDSIGPSQIDETAAYTWSGNSTFSGNMTHSGTNTHSGTEAFSQVTRMGVVHLVAADCFATTTAGTVAFTGVTPTATTAGGVQGSWTGMGAAGSDQTAILFFQISSIPRKQFGKAVRYIDANIAHSKTAGDANTEVDLIGIYEQTATADSVTRSMAVLVSDTTAVLTGAATVTDTNTNITWAATACNPDKAQYLAIRLHRKAASASTTITYRIYFDDASTWIEFDNNS